MLIRNLRTLDIDDLIILRCFGLGFKNLSKLGPELGLSQPALSQRIKKMELAFGGKILERDGRGIGLTHFGEELTARAQIALDALKIEETNDA